ncbi:hypothetical protein GF339_04025, partial [candidate division KSB3 bacterium]|nr:hypothetical protein [candidate division KSB3 bacterium]MBD3323727.1 hypothetical protein [candidate division KSB3 bacterium]
MIPLVLLLSILVMVGITTLMSGIIWFRQRKHFLALAHYNAGISALTTAA